uniref:BED-type domain-containing protein n=1 Tax=Globodera rostochiensis TaxID=31243 RepID=A0A914IB01_GLORO
MPTLHMTSTLPTSSSSSSAPLMGNIAGGIAGGGGNSAGGGTNDAHSPTAPFSLELLATLLARTANSAASTGTACVVPAPIQSNSSAFSANQSSPFATSEVALIQQLLRATNPLLNNAVVGDMAPSALQALLVAGVAQQQHRRATMLVKTELEEDELLTAEIKGSGTPPQTDKMETNDGCFKQAAMFIKTELGSVEQLQPLPHIEEEEEGAEEAKPNLQQHSQPQQQQRRQRVGGSSVKTAEVWRFFTQRPTPEQAATCQICQKTIKATNSSTTGMIRHLRSCHQTEFQQLQQARYLKNLKNDAVERQKVMLQLQLGIDPHSEASIEAIQAALESSLTALQSPPPAMNGGVAPKHSVEALISGDLRSASPNSTAQQRQLLEQIENFKTSRPTSMERLKKESGTDPTMVVVGKRGAEEVPSGGVAKAEMSASPATTPLLGTATKRRKAMSGLSEEFCQRGAVPSPAMTAMTSMVVDGSTTGDFHQQTTPRTVGKKSGASARRTMAMASAIPPQNAGPGETLAGGAKVVEQHQSERISDQIAAMMLVDQTEFLLERVGFRQFVQALVPGYTMPLGGQFRAEIIPRVAKQLQQLALFREELQRNNPFGMPPIGMLLNNSIKTVQYLHQQQHLFTGGSPTALSTSSSSSSDTPSGHVVVTNHSSNMTNLVSPSSSTEESGFHDEEQHNGSAFGSSNISGGAAAGNANGSGMGMDELVQQAAFHSQNISRSFTFSLDLNSDGSGENAGCDGIAAEKASGKEEDSDTNSSI